MLKKKAIGAFVAAATLLSGFAFASLAPVAFANDDNSGSDIEKNCEVREKDEEFHIGIYTRTLYCKDSSSSEYHEASLAERKEWSIAVAKRLNVPGELFIGDAHDWCDGIFCPLGPFVDYDRVDNYINEKLKTSDVFCYYALRGGFLHSMDETGRRRDVVTSGGPEYCDKNGCKDASIGTNEYKVCKAHGYFNDGEDHKSGSDQTPAPAPAPAPAPKPAPAPAPAPEHHGMTPAPAPSVLDSLTPALDDNIDFSEMLDMADFDVDMLGDLSDFGNMNVGDFTGTDSADNSGDAGIPSGVDDFNIDDFDLSDFDFADLLDYLGDLDLDDLAPADVADADSSVPAVPVGVVAR